MGVHLATARTLAYLLAVAAFVLAGSVPVRADDLLVGSERLFVGSSDEMFLTSEEAGLLIELHEEYVEFTDQLVKPCLNGDNSTCQGNMIVALSSAVQKARAASLRGAEKVKETSRAPANALRTVIRNGQFRYEALFALRLLNALVRQDDDCAALKRSAKEAKLSDGTSLSLQILWVTAQAELKLSKFREGKMFKSVEKVKTMCPVDIALNDSLPGIVTAE